ncbi:hypothetical protein F5X97DRAFT_320048 [Nemania serpens]|nr:hypothetical protein F5X97DRAFT_320048 [Nemania serpens]
MPNRQAERDPDPDSDEKAGEPGTRGLDRLIGSRRIWIWPIVAAGHWALSKRDAPLQGSTHGIGIDYTTHLLTYFPFIVPVFVVLAAVVSSA